MEKALGIRLHNKITKPD